MQYMNRRENPRMDVKLKCHVASARMWPHRLDGYTENISRNGLSIHWNGGPKDFDIPRVGELVTVEVELPAHHDFGQKCIHCQATVIRVNGPGDGAEGQMSLSIGYMKFREYDGSGVTPAGMYPEN